MKDKYKVSVSIAFSHEENVQHVVTLDFARDPPSVNDPGNLAAASAPLHFCHGLGHGVGVGDVAGEVENVGPSARGLTNAGDGR